MNQRLRFALCLLVFVTALIHQRESRVAIHADDDNRDSSYIAPFVRTPEEVVNRMLELAEIKPGDILYDLGSGDGRIVIAAAKKYGIKAIGFEINPALVRESQRTIKEEGLEHLVEIHEQDVRTVDLSPASVVTMYLYPIANSATAGAPKPVKAGLPSDFAPVRHGRLDTGKNRATQRLHRTHTNYLSLMH